MANKFPKKQPCKVDPDGNGVLSACVLSNGYTRGFDDGEYDAPFAVGENSATFFNKTTTGQWDSEIVFYTKCRTSGKLTLSADLADPDGHARVEFYVFDDGSYYGPYVIEDASNTITVNMTHDPAPCCSAVYVYATLVVSDAPSDNPFTAGCSWQYPN